MRQVPAVRQAHAEDRVAGFQRGEEHRLVRLCTGMGLNVDELRVEQLLGTLDCQRFRNVDELAAAVVALAGIAFRVLVRELRPLRGHDRRARVVLRGDELDVLLLAPVLSGDRGPQFGIGLVERGRAMEHGRGRAGREGGNVQV